ncbi:MAG: helicase HerA domain-containing protein [Lentimicrobium sp.]
MTPDNILLIDKNYEPLKLVLDKAASDKGINIIYTENLTAGYRELNKTNNNISAVILDIQLTEKPFLGIEIITGLRNDFPDIPVVILTDIDDTVAAKQCRISGAHDLLGRKDLDAVHFFEAIEDAVTQNKLKSQIRSRLNNKVNYIAPAIHFLKDGMNSRFTYKLRYIAIHKDNQLQDDLFRASILWHYKLRQIITSAYRDHLLTSIIMVKDGNKSLIDFYLTFTVTENEIEKLTTLTVEFIEDFESFLQNNTEDQLTPYIFEAVTDINVLSSILWPGYKNPAVRIYSKPEGWGYMGDYELEVKDSQQVLNAEFLPALPDITNISGISLLPEAMMATSGTSMVVMHLQPLNFHNNEIKFLERIIDGEISSASIGSSDTSEEYINHFNEIINFPLNNFLFEVRFLSDIHQNIPKLLKSEIEKFYASNKQIVNCTFQKGLFDNLFSIDQNMSLSRLSFMKSKEEIIPIFRFPVPETELILGVPYQYSNLQFLPADLSQEGLLLGEKSAINNIIDVRINTESLKKHMYVLGQTGTGKTTLLKTMIRDAIITNKGFCVIDPHGDLFEDVTAMIPASRKSEIVLFDTDNLADSAKLNFFKTGVQVESSMMIDEMLRILSFEYDMKMAGGPIFETYFKSILSLILHPKVVNRFKTPTLKLAYKALLLPELLEFLLGLVSDPNPSEGMENEKMSNSISGSELRLIFKVASRGKGEMDWDNVRPYIYSKLKFFVDNLYISELFDNQEPTLNFREILDTGKILLVRLKKGHIGSANLSKVGRLFLNSIIYSIMSRAELPANQRKDFFIFIDEFQNFLDGDIGFALSEVRKFNVGLILANQTIGQLNDHIFQSVLGNVGSTVFFRTGLNDIGKIRHFIEPSFSAKELVNLQNFNCIARLMSKDKPSEPFVFQTKFLQ